SMIGASGSENTGKAAGATALVYSAGLDRSDPVSLTADEAREILEQTAEDVTAANGVGVGVGDYAADGWDPHFGWGRANVGAAVRAAVAAYAPPVDGGAPLFSTTGPNPFQREFSVRLTVTAGGATGVDRRVFTALDDGTIEPAYPKRVGAGGEAPIRYADLDG